MDTAGSTSYPEAHANGGHWSNAELQSNYRYRQNRSLHYGISTDVASGSGSSSETASTTNDSVSSSGIGTGNQGLPLLPRHNAGTGTIYQGSEQVMESASKNNVSAAISSFCAMITDSNLQAIRSSPQIHRMLPSSRQHTVTPQESPIRRVDYGARSIYQSPGHQTNYSPQAFPRRDSQAMLYTGSSSQPVHSSPSKSMYGSPSKASSISTRSRLSIHMPQLSNGSKHAQTMKDVPEYLAVQEFAYRQGQTDRSSPRERIPANPFDSKFDELWKAFYQQGKYSAIPAKILPHAPPSPVGPNYDWSPLIDPYTQTPENPEGIFRLEYSRQVIEGSLNAMRSLIHNILMHGKQWEKIVADIPAPMVSALQHFPDLAYQYHGLRHAAAIAKTGRYPEGF